MAVGDGLHNLLGLVDAALEELEVPNPFQRQVQCMGSTVQCEDMREPAMASGGGGQLLIYAAKDNMRTGDTDQLTPPPEVCWRSRLRSHHP